MNLIRTAAVLLACAGWTVSPAYTQSLNKATVVFSAAAAADWITTYRTLSTYQSCDRANAVPYCAGAAREQNPLLAPLKSPAKIVATGAAIDVAGVLLARKFGKRHPKLVAVVLYGASAYRGFLAARNEIGLQQTQGRAAALNAIYGAR